MSASNVKKIRNEMLLIEEESDRYIHPDKYYIINLSINEELSEKELTEISSTLREVAQSTLSSNIYNQPLVTYTFGEYISLVFSCTDEGKKHYLGGSHHKILSAYVSSLTLKMKKVIKGNIIEFDTKTEIVTYFIWKIHSNSLESLVQNSKGTISLDDTKMKTLSELVEELQNVGVNWEEISPLEKYGIFYKLKKKKNKTVLVSLSEFFDSRDLRKYASFIFN